MVLYHWLNYFVDVQWDVYRYLRFLTPSFIFISGFIVSAIYPVSAFRSSPRISRRLLQRGLKLLALFTLLNVMASLLIGRGRDGTAIGPQAFIDRAYAIYVVGDGRALFDVLVPIAYFLLAAPVILAAASRFRAAVPAAAVATLSVAYAANLNGTASPNLELVSMALLGMLAGTVPIDRVGWSLRRPVFLTASYGLYVIAISFWNIIFPLQMIGVCLSVLGIYLLAVRAGSAGPAQRLTIQLGQYSLFAYIGQVAILQALRPFFSPSSLTVQLLAPFALTLVLMTGAVTILAVVRRESRLVDRAYRVVFA